MIGPPRPGDVCKSLITFSMLFFSQEIQRSIGSTMDSSSPAIILVYDVDVKALRVCSSPCF